MIKRRLSSADRATSNNRKRYSGGDNAIGRECANTSEANLNEE